MTIDVLDRDPKAARRRRGARAYHAGIAAESRVAQDYARRGYPVAQQRWRGAGGEIDLIVKDGAGLVFVEVKQARNFDGAIERLTPRQMRRLVSAAQEYLATVPNGSLTDLRFDVALVDGTGALRVIENAIFDL